MKRIIAFPIIEFEPKESNAIEICIWCGSSNDFNVAHIIPKSLIGRNNPHNYLKRSVCKRCNSYFGKFEGWLLKFSPLLLFRGGYFHKIGLDVPIKCIPIFLYSSQLKEWVVTQLQKEKYVDQIILLKNKKLLFIIDRNSNNIPNIYSAINENTLTYDIKTDLPLDFNPRLIYVENATIAVGRSLNQIKRLLKQIKNKELGNEQSVLNYESNPGVYNEISANLNIIGDSLFYFKWSPKIWSIYLAKIAIEFIALTFGSAFLSNPMFSGFKARLLGHEYYEIDDIETFKVNINFEMPMAQDSYIMKDNFEITKKLENDPVPIGEYFLVSITNAEASLDIYVNMGWLPSLTIKLDKKLIPMPFIQSIGYNFVTKKFRFDRLCNLEERSNWYTLVKADPNFREWYRDYLYVLGYQGK